MLLRPGFEPATSRSADRRSPNWANQAAVRLYGQAGYLTLASYLTYLGQALSLLKCLGVSWLSSIKFFSFKKKKSKFFWILVDEDDDRFNLIQPTLIQQLKTILDQYPDDGQILKVRNVEG